MRAIADFKNSMKVLKIRSRNDGELTNVSAVDDASLSAVDEATASRRVELALKVLRFASRLATDWLIFAIEAPNSDNDDIVVV
jgi:hypothetical protein